MSFTADTIQKVWEKAATVANNDPAVWRKDECGTWPRPAIQKLKEEIEALATERHARVLRLALQPDLEDEIKERLFQQMTNFEAASAELSDAVEAFEEAQRSLPERPRPNVRLRMR